MAKSLFILLALLSFVACGKKEYLPIEGHIIPMRYSTLLTMTECNGGYTVADIKDPWKGGIKRRYVLLPKGMAVPDDLPDGILLRTPLDRNLLLSTVHTHLFLQLGREQCVKGVCDAQYINDHYVKRGIDNGTIKNCGSSLNVNSEMIISLKPSAIWLLPYENGGYGKLEKIDAPLIECLEYMETTPLGQAEWIRFYGRLLGCGELADSIFNTTCERYETLRDSIARVEYRPTLMCEMMSSSAWYVPAGGSTMGQLYRDAGADYLFSYTQGSGSVPLSYETVLSQAKNADIWLMKYNAPTDRTYTTLLDDNKRYAHFMPYMKRNIYHSNQAYKRLYDETPFRPDILLEELAAIFHPHLFPDYKLRYYETMHE